MAWKLTKEGLQFALPAPGNMNYKSDVFLFITLSAWNMCGVVDTANSELLPVEANVPAVNTDIIGIVSDKPIIGEEVAEGEEEEEEDQSSLVLPTQQINPDNLITLKENQEPEIVKDR
ncbi:hypothetical protein O3M35_010897 [Rhynocoris fuscipes]|uniref:Uncharacterized protein n=1 Tax=Rhynocoris fuscipes TaxID=488301 RepID=A0AAW1D4C3_9HEMI